MYGCVKMHLHMSTGTDKRINISLPIGLWRESKLRALDEGITLSELVRRCLNSSGIKEVYPNCDGVPDRHWNPPLGDFSPAIHAAILEDDKRATDDYEYTPVKAGKKTGEPKSKFATASKLLPRDGE